jgi:hypothetical protein
MFYGYRKAAAALAALLCLLLLSACNTTGVSAAGAKLSGNALVNVQQTSSSQTTTSSDLSLTVQPYPTPFTVYEVGDTMNHVLATGTDDLGPGDPITATIDWGDHTTPTQYTFIDGRAFQIAGSHAYSKVGKYTITVTAAITAFQQSVSGTGVITVVPAYTLKVNNFKPAVGRALNGVIATGTDPFANDSLKGTINWGDNTTPTSVQTTSSAQGSFQIQATHTYNQVANFTITVSLTSIIVGPIQGTGTATVPNTFTLSANTIKARVGRLFSANVATITGTVSAGGLIANVEWGDGTVSKMLLGGGKGTIKIQGSHTYSQAGTYTIIVIVKDKGTGEQAHANGTVIVRP